MKHAKIGLATAVSLLALAALASPLGARQAASKSSAETPPERVHLYVVDIRTKSPVPNALVFALSKDGQKLAMDRTDAYGEAFLPIAPATDIIDYVIVDAQYYHIGGVRWVAGLKDYYIPITSQLEQPK
jgi:hypothetical protein